MTSSSVVVLEPRCKGRCAVSIAGEDLAVGPFGLQGPVEAFDLAVLPWAVRLDEHLTCIELGAYVADRPAVGPSVVGHDALNAGDPVGVEVGSGAAQELRAVGPFSSGKTSEYANREWSSTSECM